MATYYNSYNINVTSTTGEIVINGLSGPIGNPVVQLRTFLNGTFIQWVEVDTSWILSKSYTYINLTPNTVYTFDIEIWSDRDKIEIISDSFTTSPSGGGGGDTPVPQPSEDDGCVWIFFGFHWRKAISYIYTYGKDGNLGWQKCGE